MDGVSPGGLLALGIIVGLLSTCVQSFGLTLQRKSHIMEDLKDESEPRRAPYQRRVWQVGMFLFLLANIVGSSIQITTLPLPLLSTLQASGLVFNSIMASLILKETWTWQTVVGTVLVAGGAVMISMFSAVPEPSHNLEQLTQLFWRPTFLVWFGLSILFVLCTLVADFTMRKFISAQKAHSPKIHLIRGMAYGMLSGILSAHALLLAKSAVELIVRSIADKVNQFNSYKSVLLILAFLTLSLTQLYYLHLGLRLVSTSILYPFVFCIYNIVAILDGLIYFRQTDSLPPLHAGLIGLGTFILLAGVLALSWRLQDEDESNTLEHPHVAKAEIPQTVLAPGMGFVGEPESESDHSPTEDDDDDEQTLDGESSPLLGRARGRSKSVRSGRRVSIQTQSSRRRKRASTLKEVLAIWEELGDREAEERYGTLDQAIAVTRARPMSSGDGLDDHDEDHALANSVDALREQNGNPRAVLKRSSTTPDLTRQQRKISTHHTQGSALFSDMLKVQWWRTRRKKDTDEESEHR
ncbi:hypothetical protein AMS68_006386 [Peltaster fructicola]|uniref:Uncharacterized protein n=1 Tax=Peltaster fructicola TaxID=286661 RepID=A0A6H0Y1X5_9PEZI|nr:hypothetical protein AMS68_006386 [Peltaster fructicola]